MRWATRAAPQGRYPRDIIRPYERFYRQRTGGGIFAHDASVVACAPDVAGEVLALFRQQGFDRATVIGEMAAGEAKIRFNAA